MGTEVSSGNSHESIHSASSISNNERKDGKPIDVFKEAVNNPERTVPAHAQATGSATTIPTNNQLLSSEDSVLHKAASEVYGAMENQTIAPLNTNKYAHQCPYCLLWKLKSTFNDHAKQCGASNPVRLVSHEKNSQTQSSVKAVVTHANLPKKGCFSQAKKKDKIAAKSINNTPYLKPGNKRPLFKKGETNCQPSKKRGKAISQLSLDTRADVKTEYNSWDNGESRSFSWDFAKDVLEHFQSVRNSVTGFDVTLACWDDQYCRTATSQAHRMLLSAASPVLRTILYVTNLKQTNAFVYLNGVTHRDISYILHYIYQGEAQIPLQHLSSFIAAARLLKLKGIPLLHT